MDRVDEESWMEALMLVVFLGGILMICGSILTARRWWQDLLMIFGSGLGTLGLGIGLLFVFEMIKAPSHRTEEFLAYAGLGSFGVGMLLFSMGFLVDQVRYRAILSHQKQFAEVQAAARTIAEQKGRTDG